MEDNNVNLKDWLVEGKKQLDLAREALRYLCAPIPPPREMEQYLHYFCGDASNPNALSGDRASARIVLQGRGESLYAPLPTLRKI